MKSSKSKKMHSVYVDMNEDKEEKLSKYEICEIIKNVKNTEDLEYLLAMTKHDLPEIRLKAIQRTCPCRVLDDIKEFWDRIFEMVYDPCPKVRYQVLHNMCDGSPPEYENKVVEALDIFNRDEDKDVKRMAHKVLGSYLKTGKYNIL